MQIKNIFEYFVLYDVQFIKSKRYTKIPRIVWVNKELCDSS